MAAWHTRIRDIAQDYESVSGGQFFTNAEIDRMTQDAVFVDDAGERWVNDVVVAQSYVRAAQGRYPDLQAARMKRLADREGELYNEQGRNFRAPPAPGVPTTDGGYIVGVVLSGNLLVFTFSDGSSVSLPIAVHSGAAEAAAIDARVIALIPRIILAMEQVQPDAAKLDFLTGVGGKDDVVVDASVSGFTLTITHASGVQTELELDIPNNPEIRALARSIVASWAQDGNTDPIPAPKLANAPPGPAGPAGPQGAQGPQGLRGVKGDPGDAAAIAHAVTLDPSTFTASDDGTFPAWKNADGRWENGRFLDANGISWTYNSATNFWSAAVRLASATAAGLLAPPEFTRILDSIDAAHLHDVPHYTISQLADDDAFLFDDSSIAEGAGSQLREIAVSELDKRWRNLTPAQQRDIVAFLGDIRPAGWVNASGVRIGASSRAGAYTLAQARAYSSWQANGSVVNSGGSLLEQRNVLIESETELDPADPRLRAVVTFHGQASIGDAGQIALLGANADGNRWFYNAHFIRLPGDAQVSVQVDAPSTLVNIAIDAANVTGLHAPPEPTQNLPAVFTPPEEFLLVQPVEFNPFETVTPAALSQGIIGATLSNSWNINLYPAGFSTAALRGKLVVLASPGVMLSTISIDEGEHTLQPLTGVGIPPHAYEVLDAPGWTEAPHRVWLTAGDAFYPPQVTYGVGTWVANSPSTLIPLPGSAASWATNNSDELIPDDKVRGAVTLHDGVLTGLTFTGADVFGNLQLFDPAFDISGKRGAVIVDVGARFATRSATTIGFTQAGLTDYEANGVTSARRVIASTAFAANQTNGVTVGSPIPIYNGDTLIATVTLRLAKNGEGSVGIYPHCDSASSSHGNFSLALDGYIAFIHG